ncbi:GntR family transcriptional regulator [Cryobacterium tepidiphilum]|uniref:GntR family transcriptional regulator n=1 Tax=Cryobacterium tepidiphilum TaxID=2486026 RepID=A0A3M8LC12_9MICO|nr:GntR family transcriptional regulator [Cryobacterium tepidiphilum]RNE62204.1 GntR family transcriptional regulator [Cryobacterium tepidiphilum]
MRSARLPRVTLAEQVRDFLVLEIAQGRIPPGTPLRELEIAEQLGTSQTPVREAFRALAALGLLESRIHVGTRVREVAEQDLVDAVPVRSALEGVAGRLAAPRMKGEGQELRAAFDAMLHVAASGDRLAYADASTQFHRSIVQAARNESLLRAWNALGIEVMTIMTMASTDVPLEVAAESHREVLEALESGDPEQAEQLLAHHVAEYLPGRLQVERHADDGRTEPATA